MATLFYLTQDQLLTIKKRMSDVANIPTIVVVMASSAKDGRVHVTKISIKLRRIYREREAGRVFLRDDSSPAFPSIIRRTRFALRHRLLPLQLSTSYHLLSPPSSSTLYLTPNFSCLFFFTIT